MIKHGHNKPLGLTRGAGKSGANRNASMLAARREAESEPSFWDRHDSKACNFPRSPLNERMSALLDRLDKKQHAVTGPPPTRVSFVKIAEWCARAGQAPARQLNLVYRELLQSYLSGAFEQSFVFNLTHSAPDLSETELAGHRMRRNFLAARARSFSPDNTEEADALFKAYLAPCWIHRAATVRWLETRGYPVPTWWKPPLLPELAKSPLLVQPERKQNRRGAKTKYPRDEIRKLVFELMDYHGDFLLGDGAWRCEASLASELMTKFGMADSTAKLLLKQPLCEWRESKGTNLDGPII
jgi:hypothetical protein